MNWVKVVLFFVSCSALAQTPDTGKASINLPNRAQPTDKSNATNNMSKSGVGSFNSKELEQKLSKRVKDPFMIPNYLYFKIKKKLSEVEGEGYVDESIEPQRRWALKHYQLVAIIWNVKKPKAMITDKLMSFHTFQRGDPIGNGGGVITSIEEGQIVVNENGLVTTLKITK